MATYKVLQDIEAEDKILGPLTLKQFIFAIITIALVFLAVFVARANPILALPWLLPIIFFGFMATPIGRDQPNDVWLAARIRFLIKPRKRVWNQAGMQELVTITVPKKIEIDRTDGLSQTEVKSRLSALSNLMDTRGWAIKDVSSPMPTFSMHSNEFRGDRLVEISSLSASMPVSEVTNKEDILDPLNNMIAQRIDSAIKQQQLDRINSLKKDMQDGSIANKVEIKTETKASPIDYSFINNGPAVEPGYTTFGTKVINPGQANTADELSSPIPSPSPDSEEEAILDRIHHQKELQEEIKNSSHEHVINPISATPKPSPTKLERASNQSAPNAILKELGQANDISVASIANLAKRADKEASLSDNDVISLH